MNKAKITFKGQVTIPKDIRNALAIKEGDSVIFIVQGDHAVLKPIKKKSLIDFYGALSATRPYPGLEAVREEVHGKRAKRFIRKDTE
jgi:antitoxin PrlF